MVEKLSARKNVNEGRYLKFYGKKKTPEPHQLPPTGDAFLFTANVFSMQWQ